MLDLLPSRVRTDILSPGTHRATGSRRYRVAFLPGCAQQVLNGDINSASIRVLQRAGCDVVVATGTVCCGSLPLHMGNGETARRLAMANITAWQHELDGEGLDAIIVNASGCGSTMKDYAHLLADTPYAGAMADRIAWLTRDFSEWISEIGLPETHPLPGYRTAYHDPCSMRNVQKVTTQPRKLLREAGLDVVDIPEAHFCCGSAGTYNILQPDLAETLGRRKASAIGTTAPDIVATANIGCMVQIERHLGQPVIHVAELLDWATGGPRPSGLAEVPLPDRAVMASADKSKPDIPEERPSGSPEGGGNLGLW